MNKHTLFLTFAIIISTLGCASDSPAPTWDIIITGDISTVQNHRSLNNLELEFIQEYVNPGRKEREYRKVLDLDEDGIEDIDLLYYVSTNDQGLEVYASTLYSKNNTLRTAGNFIDISGIRTWTPLWLEEGVSINQSSDLWSTTESPTATLFYVNSEDGSQINLFPPNASEGYLIFTLLNKDNKLVMGWLKLKQTNDKLKPVFVDVGYSILN